MCLGTIESRLDRHADQRSKLPNNISRTAPTYPLLGYDLSTSLFMYARGMEITKLSATRIGGTLRLEILNGDQGYVVTPISLNASH